MSSTENIPLYKKIKEWIKEKIKDGDLLPGDQLPTEIELAEMFKVSRITSKRALEDLKREGVIHRKRGQGSFVSRTTSAGTINKSKLISLIIPYETTKGKLINYIKGATDVLSVKGYFLTIYSTDWDVSKERNLLQKLPKEDISGIILYPINSTDNIDLLHNLKISNYPIVAIDKYIEGVSIDSVISDNRGGNREAVNHLIGLGHKNIAFLSTASLGEATSVRDRYYGYCEALVDSGISVQPEFTVTGIKNKVDNRGDKSLSEFYEPIIRDFLNKGVTALVIENDYIAFDILETLSKMEISVPDEISVIGFDNVEMIEPVDWELTTVDQSIYEIGRKAAEVILRKLENGDTSGNREIVPVKLIVRDTTASREIEK